MSPECEVCGKDVPRTKKFKIEGAIMSVCYECSDLGTPIVTNRQRQGYRRSSSSSTGGNKQGQTQSTTQGSIPKTTQGKGPSQGYDQGAKKFVGKTKPKPQFKKANINDLKVVDGYKDLLLWKRTKLNMSKAEFADSLKMRRSFYDRVEKGDAPLSIPDAKKIERKYKLKLLEKEDSIDAVPLRKYMSDDTSYGSKIYFKEKKKKEE